MARRVGVIGTGLMGLGVASRLAARGHAVHGRDIRPEADAAARTAGATIHPSPASLARAVEVVITLVVDAAQTEEVLFGADGVVGAMAPGGVVIVASTIAPKDAADFGRRLVAAGLRALDAPVSGGPAKARDGSMSTMVGGPRALLDEHADLFADMAGRVFHIGEAVGDGSKVKIVNNMLAAVNLVAAGEAMALAERMGLDPRTVFDVVRASSGASFVFDTRMGRVVEGDPSVHAAAHILTKDVGLACAAAREAASPSPLADLAAEVFRATIAMGLGERDDGAVIEWYRKRDGGAGGS
ncbi:MAG: NAD(P)-dependent oxidoreductase [Siculibacillus sp.]|nr:NAD(P)-dependent oxidoreductase [Siculibacillus sp.]